MPHVWIATLAAALLLWAPLAHGGGGKFNMIVTAGHDYKSIQHMDGRAFAGVLEGMAQVTKSTGDPFPVGMHFDMKCVVYGKTRPKGVDLQTSCTGADIGDPNVLLYMTGSRAGGTVEKGGGGVGAVELVGGTGPFEGITANCSYDASYPGPKRSLTLMECDWR